MRRVRTEGEAQDIRREVSAQWQGRKGDKQGGLRSHIVLRYQGSKRMQADAEGGGINGLYREKLLWPPLHPRTCESSFHVCYIYITKCLNM